MMTGGLDDRWVIVGRYHDPLQAAAACSMLRAYGLDALLPDLNSGFALEGGSFALGGVRLMVPAEDEADARALITTPMDTQEGEAP